MTSDEIAAALAEPFEAREVKFKPQSVKNNRCLAMAYIDARLIMDRLDDVIGVENWRDEYTILNDGSVQCHLGIRFGGEWVTKCDVGSPSEQPDGGDRLKAAFSDALKRAAVKFGVGRYLYRLSSQWVDYDPTKRQIVQPPQLPAWALPKGKGAPTQKAPAQQQQQGAPQPPKTADNLPATGAELLKRLRDYEAKLAKAGRCSVGALVNHVSQAGVKAGYGADVAQWSGPAIPFAVDAVKEFEKAIPKTQQSIEGTGGAPRATNMPD